MRYNRLQPLAVYITTMGMELCCLYLALLWVMEKFGPGYITITIILTVYPASLFLRLLFSKSAPGTESGRLPIVFIGIAVTALIAGLSMWAGSASQPAFGQQDVLGLALQVVLLALAGWLGFNSSRVPPKSSVAPAFHAVDPLTKLGPGHPFGVGVGAVRHPKDLACFRIVGFAII